jgi:hypothetical protein
MEEAPRRGVGTFARYRHSMNVLGRSIFTVRCCVRRSAQARDQPFHGRKMPIAATSCRYLSPGQLFGQGSRGGVAGEAAKLASPTRLFGTSHQSRMRSAPRAGNLCSSALRHVKVAERVANVGRHHQPEEFRTHGPEPYFDPDAAGSFGRIESATPWMNAVIFTTSSSFNLPVKSGMPCDLNGPLKTMALRFVIVSAPT